MKKRIVILSVLLALGIVLLTISIAMSLSCLTNTVRGTDTETQTDTPDTTVPDQTSAEAESTETADITATAASESSDDTPSPTETESIQTEESPAATPAVTAPPVTTPAVTEPPVTTPAVTEPPVTTPAVTEPPVTTPAVTEPPVTTPAVIEPPVTTPAVIEPPVTTPAVTEPEMTPPVETETEEVTIEEPEPAIPIIDENARVPAEYCTTLKQAEIYSPFDTRELKVHGISRSDGNYAAVYGECPIGVTVHIENEHGRFSVISEKGCFAVRIYNPGSIARFTVTLSSKGRPVGDTLTRSTLIKKSNDTNEWAVFIGEENQGFYHKMVPDFVGANLLTNDMIQTAKDRWQSRVERLRGIGDGCEIICLLAPSSMTVYPELAPKEALSYAMNTYFSQHDHIKQAETTRFDQISQLLTEAGVTVIDLRETFGAHKYDTLPIYYNYDTHWTEYGSYLAYVKLYQYISQKYPTAAPHTFNHFSWECGYYTGGDIPGYFNLDINGVFEYACKRTMRFTSVPAVQNLTRYTTRNNLGWHSYSDELRNGGIYDTERSDLPDIYVIRNSYGASIYDLLLDRSNRALFRPMFSYTFNIAEIQQNEPDYLIYILSEWNLNELLEN
ncbi:MAG: hypothetical protein IJC98_06350 [Clostridia bacterium]|nr:hypothetical protein [Clostridia bacterium]